MNVQSSLLALGLPGGYEWILIAMLGLLIFGKRLPDVGKSLGKSIVEFKKGLRGIEDDLDKAVEKGDQADMLPPPDDTQSSTETPKQDPVSNKNSEMS